jgi:anaerobic selenocysteine-containing dehydrogenase
MEVRVEGGRAVGVRGMDEHPLNRGRLCLKAPAAIDLAYSSGRVAAPMVREGAGWRKVDWDYAMDLLVGELKERREADPRSFAMIIGMPILLGGSTTVGLLRRFMDVYGSPNCFSPESMCYRHQIIGYTLVLGKFPVPDVENSSCIVVWGHNPHESKPPLAWRLEEARRRGAKLIVVDPRRTKAAEMADIHASIRPGSDIYLAVGLMKVIVEEGLYDKGFVERWTVGFDKLREHLSKYSLAYIAERTWLDEDLIVKVARTFAKVKPACIVQGVNALDQVAVGVQNARSIAMLHALTGNVDVRGGLVRASRSHTASLRLPHLLKDPPLGVKEHPLFYQVWDVHLGEGQAMYLYDAILEGRPYPVEALFIAGSNPLLTWPESSRLAEALRKVKFLAVMDLFMTDTAKHAHLLLPAATFLERYELCDYYSVIFGIPYMMLRKKCIEPLGESRSDVELWLELARRMGFTEHFPWRGVEEVLDYALRPTGYTFKDLEEANPSGVWLGAVNYGEYLKRGFKTPSGKVELYSETLAKHGYDPLPTPKEPYESPYSEGCGEYPLVLTTGSRLVLYTHSQLRNVERLRRQCPEPYVEVNPDTARTYGLRDGGLALVETRRGGVVVKVKVTPSIAPRVLNMPHGWSEANVNLLTSRRPADPISGCPELKALMARARPL